MTGNSKELRVREPSSGVEALAMVGLGVQYLYTKGRAKWAAYALTLLIGGGGYREVVVPLMEFYTTTRAMIQIATPQPADTSKKTSAAAFIPATHALAGGPPPCADSILVGGGFYGCGDNDYMMVKLLGRDSIFVWDRPDNAMRFISIPGLDEALHADDSAKKGQKHEQFKK